MRVKYALVCLAILVISGMRHENVVLGPTFEQYKIRCDDVHDHTYNNCTNETADGADQEACRNEFNKIVSRKRAIILSAVG